MRSRIALCAVLVVMMLIGGGGRPAFAADPLPFSSTVNFKYRLESRRFVPAGSRVCLESKVRGDTQRPSYKATLFRDDTFGDENRGAKTFSTLVNSKQCWTNAGHSSYYIEFLKTNDGVYMSGAVTFSNS